MAVSLEDTGGEIFVNLGGTGRFSGSSSNVIDYSYTEGSTPLVPGDESGAIGDVSIDVLNENNASILLYKDEFLLDDKFHGSILGSVESVSGSNDTVTMGGRSKLALLNVDTVIAPRSGTIGNVIESVVNELGITTNVVKDAGLSNTSINSPGFEGDAWVYIKRLCSAYQVEVTLIRDYVIIRPTRQRTIASTDLADKNWQLQDIQLAQKFDVAYYNYTPRTDYLVHPEGGWTPEAQVYQVAANETTEFEVDLQFFLTSIEQPTVRDTVSKTYDSSSAYSVSGNDNLPVSAAFWTAYKGGMSFEILGDGSRVRVTITGPKYEPLSPYNIGISDGSTSYSTLRIVGSGMDFNRQVYTASTGLTASEAPLLNGGEIDNPSIDTLGDAKAYSLFARRLYSLPTQTYSTSSNDFPQVVGSIPSIFYTTFEEFDAKIGPTYTFTDFNTEYAGMTFAELTEDLGNVAPQGFGEVAGSRVALDDAVYRVRNTTITPNTVSFDAEYDTLFDDVNNVFGDYSWYEMEATWAAVGTTWATVVDSPYAQVTFSDFNTVFAGATFTDYALVPLRREAIAA